MQDLDPSVYSSQDFLRLVVAHLYRYPRCLRKAKELKITPDDFVTSNNIGLQLYRALAKIALQMNPKEEPMPIEIAKLLVDDRAAQFEILPHQQMLAKQHLDELYSFDLNEASCDFISHNLAAFAKHRRETRALIEHGNDPDALFSNLSRIREEITQVTQSEKKWTKNIFLDNKMPEIIQFIPTGIPELDAALGGGLGVGEYGQVIGFSGGGKTTLGVTLVSNAARLGYNAMYISREEGEQGIVNRFRAKNYGLSYQKLRSGLITQQELDQVAEEHADIRDMLIKHMRLMDVRDFGSFNAMSIINEVERVYREEGFAPALLVIDQLDYIEPIDPRRNEQEWERYSRVAFELDTKVSHYLVGGKHPMSIWLLHQAKGKEKKIFTTEEITGFKGIVKPADLVLGIGRDKDEFNLFTLKARHGPRFALPMSSNLEYMEFVFNGNKSNNMFSRDNSTVSTGRSRNMFA